MCVCLRAYACLRGLHANNVSKDPARFHVLTRDHAPETALLFALRSDHGRALAVVHTAYARTLQLWAGLHPLARHVDIECVA